jgi:hypothetical protein
VDFWRWYFWIAPHIVMAACLVLMVRRHLQSSYAFLTAYFSFQLAVTVVGILYDLSMPPGTQSLQGFRWFNTVTTGINTILQVCILYGLANDLILSRSSLRRFLNPLFRWTAAVFVLASAAICAALPRTGLDGAMAGLQVVGFSSNLLKLGLLLSLLIFSGVLRVSWSALPSGIALGFGVAAVGELIGSALYSTLTPGVSAWVEIDFVRLGGWHLAVLIWLFYLVMEGRGQKTRDSEVHQSDLEFWNEELRKLLGKESQVHQASDTADAEEKAIVSGRIV